MTRRTVQSAGITYTIADDDATPGELQQWAVVRTRAVDELTGQPPRARVRVVTPLEHTPPAQARVLRKMTSRSVEGGICGLVARVSDVASALARSGELAARIEASGYLPRDLTPAIDQARRTLSVGAGIGATALTVAPGDPVPPPPEVREQFRPGRGVLVQRPANPQPDQFTRVGSAVPAGPTDVPIAPPLAAPRVAGIRVAGVPLHLPDQPLHRAAAIRLRGRIQERLLGPPAGLTPAIGAEVGILSYWPTYPSTIAGAPIAVDFVAVDPPLYLDYPAGASVDPCTLTPAGPALRVLVFAPAGSRELAIAPFATLNSAGGDVLQIEAAASNEAEVVVTDGYALPADPLGPAQVRLRTPTAYVHRAQAAGQRMTVAVGGPPTAGPTTREALAGDAVVFATDVTALTGGSFLTLDNAGPRAAYHRVRRIPAATRLVSPPPPHSFAVTDFVTVDAEGYFEWPAIARVAQLEIAVMYGGFSIAPTRFALDYEGANPLSLLVP